MRLNRSKCLEYSLCGMLSSTGFSSFCQMENGVGLEVMQTMLEIEIEKQTVNNRTSEYVIVVI